MAFNFQKAFFEILDQRHKHLREHLIRFQQFCIWTLCGNFHLLSNPDSICSSISSPSVNLLFPALTALQFFDFAYLGKLEGRKVVSWTQCDQRSNVIKLFWTKIN